MAEDSKPKKLTDLDKVRAKAVYNFHNRKRQAEEEARLKEELEAGTFDADYWANRDAKTVVAEPEAKPAPGTGFNEPDEAPKKGK